MPVLEIHSKTFFRRLLATAMTTLWTRVSLLDVKNRITCRNKQFQFVVEVHVIFLAGLGRIETRGELLFKRIVSKS